MEKKMPPYHLDWTWLFSSGPVLGHFALRSHEGKLYATLRDSDKGPLYIIKVFVFKGQPRHRTVLSGVNFAHIKGNCLKMSILGYMARHDIFYSVSGTIAISRIDDNSWTESQCYIKIDSIISERWIGSSQKFCYSSIWKTDGNPIWTDIRVSVQYYAHFSYS